MISGTQRKALLRVIYVQLHATTRLNQRRMRYTKGLNGPPCPNQYCPYLMTVAGLVP